MTATANDPIRTAARWLDHTYGGLVVPADQSLAETESAWLVSCAYADRSAPGALLAVTLTVPKDGGDPYPAANADPLADLGGDGWPWRSNARGCLVATDAAVSGHPASALPWRPEDERPGWWDRMLARHFPDAEVAECGSWSEVAAAVVDGGDGTRGAVWLRRRVNGVDLTGHLLYAQHVDGRAVFIDGQRGDLAHLDDSEVASLVLARFHRPDVPPAPALAAAPDLPAAIAKATAWLDGTYAGAVTLVDPDESDETNRGWLFACTPRRFTATGDWRDQMLDAAVVVPKAAGDQPFGLPNTDPWPWLRAWDTGTRDLPTPPDPSGHDWYTATVGDLALSTHTHHDWPAALATITALPPNAKALVWVRRTDDRGRETVGNLLVATRENGEVHLIDGRGTTPAIDLNPLALHVIALP